MTLAQYWYCPSCGELFKDHSNTQLRKCKLILDICLLDKDRKVSVEQYQSLGISEKEKKSKK